MREAGKLMAALVLGAGGMYLLDPDRGPRRRSLLRDRAVRTRRVLGDGAATVARDVRNRSAGTAAALRSRLRADQAGDEIIQERVRATLGRVVAHPGAIQTAVFDGRLFLSGPVLAREVDDLLATVRRVRGVREVENQLQVHDRPGSVPALQGEGRPRAEDAWTPTGRLVAGTAAGLLALLGVRSRGLPRAALSALGGALLARAGVAPARRPGAVEVRKTLTVNAPLEEVWALWSAFENFPRFLTHVREVRRGSGHRSHWTAAGPGGRIVEWEAETTDWRPQEMIGWRSVEGSTIDTSGMVRFRRAGEGATEIDLRLSVGHTAAALLGGDFGRLVDESVERLKSLLEEGSTRERVELEELPEGGEAGRPR